MPQAKKTPKFVSGAYRRQVGLAPVRTLGDAIEDGFRAFQGQEGQEARNSLRDHLKRQGEDPTQIADAESDSIPTKSGQKGQVELDFSKVGIAKR